MKKKKIIIFVICFILLIGLSVILYLWSTRETTPFKYICVSDTQEENQQTIIRYEATVSQNKIIHFLEEKQYVFKEQMYYYTKMYDLSIFNVDYTGNDETLTITIHGYNDAVIDENGEVISPNYLEYMEQYITDEFVCKIGK